MIGVLGGTFDPVHFGHLRTALDVQQALSLDEVRFVPAGEPPHRQPPQADPLQRLAMVRAAIAGQPGFVADDREIRRGGPSYMVDTLASLKQDFPEQDLCLLLGSDAFQGLPQWHRWQAIFDDAGVVVMQRPGSDSHHANAELQQRVVDSDTFCRQPQGKVCFVPVSQLAIAATQLRQMWQQGRDIRFFLPDAVLTLIRQQHIY